MLQPSVRPALILAERRINIDIFRSAFSKASNVKAVTVRFFPFLRAWIKPSFRENMLNGGCYVLRRNVTVPPKFASLFYSHRDWLVHYETLYEFNLLDINFDLTAFR